MKIRIDGKECEANYGEYVLEVAARNNIYIPSLCHDEALPGQACCRMCIVEVVEKNRSKVVTSCVYPVTSEADVITNSEKLIEMRRTIIMLLYARSPENTTIKRLAKIYSVSQSERFKTGEKDECILCNLCVSACEKMGTSAISTVHRGITKKVSTPFNEASPSCIGCAACANICPGGVIKVSEEDGTRTIWNKEFELVKCSGCGECFATYEQLQYGDKRLDVKLKQYEDGYLCENCREAASIVRLKGIYEKL